MSKYFKDVRTLQDLKKAYKKVAVKLHPDNNGGRDAEFKEMQAEYDKLYQKLYHTKAQSTKDKTTNKKASYEDIKKESDLFKDIIDKLIHFDVTIDIVGTWLWVYGNTYGCKDTLKELGFSWASQKKKWYYHNKEDGWTKKGRTLNYEQITSLHGCENVKTAEEKKKGKVLVGA